MYFQSDAQSFTLQNQKYVDPKNQGNYLCGK